jgi:hypothetical protein
LTRGAGSGQLACVPAALGLFLLVGLASPEAAEVREAARAVLSQPAYQSELPGDPEFGAAPTSAAPRPHRWDGPRLADGSPIAGVLMWSLIGIFVVLAGAVAWRELKVGRAGEPAGPDGGDGDAPAPVIGPAPLADAEALAALGQFAEAVHVLLLRTLQALSRRADVPEALTSREVLGTVSLAPPARAALGQLVDAVEVTRFGGAAAGRADYDRCVAAYRAFVGTLGGRRA